MYQNQSIAISENDSSLPGTKKPTTVRLYTIIFIFKFKIFNWLIRYYSFYMIILAVNSLALWMYFVFSISFN